MADSRKPAILIVDDDAENIRILMGTLGKQYSVLAAMNGEKALELASSAVELDLILLDILMPEMDGFEVCARLKQDARLASIPVIFVSALDETADKVKGLELGGQDYITKPFQYEEVHARVRTHVALYHLQHELQMKNQQLEEMERLKDNLWQMIVHDLRSPLSGAMGFLELANNNPGEAVGSETAFYLERSAACLDQICEMVEQLLDISRLEENRLPLRLEPHDLGVLAIQASQQVASLATEHELVVVPSEAVPVACDAPLTLRVLQNLLTNALKFSPCGSRIEVRAEQDGAWVLASVRDAGRGIPPAVQNRIFDKFYQNHHEDRAQGKGLGLTFCKMAVEAQGGTIGVRNNEDVGATFWFTLPAKPSE